MPFRPLTPDEWEGWKPPCMSPEHYPPNSIVLPPGYHVWVCPACGHETGFSVPDIRCQEG